MIDIHSHILFDIDDGAIDIETSITMLKQAYNAGFSDVIFTPHYMENDYINNRKELVDKINILYDILEKENINLGIHIGNEVFLTPGISKKIIDKAIQTLGDSKYILFEVPMQTKVLYLEKEIDILIENGFIPIMAHPERYNFVQNNIKYLKPFLKKGVLLQGNYPSALGYYGEKIEQTFEKILKKKWYSFMGSDSHSHKNIYNKMDIIIEKLENWTDKSYIAKITDINAQDLF